MQYNYILLNEGFYQWLETNYLPVSAQILFLNLIHQFNLSGWSEWIEVNNRRIMAWVQTKREQTAIEIRDKILEKGLVVYVKGKKAQPNKYKLNENLPFINEAQTVVKDVVFGVVEPVVKSVAQTANKYKQNKTKQNHIESNKLLSQSNSDSLFEKFWDVYPKKVAKQAALKVFRKIPKIEVTLENIIAGVKQWILSEQWQNPQFIPNPATFLSNRRWEDEIPKGGSNYGNNRGYSGKQICTEYPE